MTGLAEFPFALESRLLNRFDMHRYAREAYNMGIRYIGACCGLEPYHVRAIAEELAEERGKLPPASEKHACGETPSGSILSRGLGPGLADPIGRTFIPQAVDRTVAHYVS
ncbi:hypothetical protein OS493_016529 [Desmophyllum pertusum]|uniref:Hcy-binding domain-containing protein n=1 Tax=Desmophyllum pertusum TaxID=174260 RepID=A0A9W9ZQ48_9CNID|nr:hypothetical protein OS493_016529 [Desmophyllum pertusum]